MGLARKKNPSPTHPQEIVFEVTQRCNNNCLFCYNVWKNKIDYPGGELSTEQSKDLIRKIITGAKCKYLTFTGGEPFLRRDLLELVSFARQQGVGVSIFSNATLITQEVARDYIKADASLFKLSLLSADKKMHNYLSQNDCFDKVTESIANVKLYDGQVIAVFVGTRRNIDNLAEMIELAVALGVDGIMFNRFNAGGEGTKYIDELLPAPAQVIKALKVIEDALERYEIPISCSMPIQPCVIDTSRFKKIKFTYCVSGENPLHYAVDSLGNLRPCDQSPFIVGNLLNKSFNTLTQEAVLSDFRKQIPEFCKSCKLAHLCQGGCKASAEACYGSLSAEEPFLRYYKNVGSHS